MPGTLVSDSLAAVLHSTTITTDATTTGSAVEVSKPGNVQIEAVFGTLTGDGSTTTDIEIQGSNASGFGSGVVSYGRFSQAENDDEDATTVYLRAYVTKRYLRSVITTAGGVTSLPVVITVREPNYKRTVDTTA